MRKGIVFAVFFLLLLMMAVPYGCTDRKAASADSAASDTLVNDTSSLDSTETLIAETPVPRPPTSFLTTLCSILRPTASCR